MGDHLSDLAADKNVVYHRGTMNPNFQYSVNNQERDERSNISRICLTGGPCAGKTTAIAAIKQDLT